MAKTNKNIKDAKFKPSAACWSRCRRFIQQSPNWLRHGRNSQIEVQVLIVGLNAIVARKGQSAAKRMPVAIAGSRSTEREQRGPDFQEARLRRSSVGKRVILTICLRNECGFESRQWRLVPNFASFQPRSGMLLRAVARLAEIWWSDHHYKNNPCKYDREPRYKDLSTHQCEIGTGKDQSIGRYSCICRAPCTFSVSVCA